MNMMAVARRVLSEFEEMPGMSLTHRQASRLFGLDDEMCRIVLEVLVESDYLRETTNGRVTLAQRIAA